MATQMEVADYHSLPRRELQNLCKKHGIPANKTNAYMADALSSLSKVFAFSIYLCILILVENTKVSNSYVGF